MAKKIQDTSKNSLEVGNYNVNFEAQNMLIEGKKKKRKSFS